MQQSISHKWNAYLIFQIVKELFLAEFRSLEQFSGCFMYPSGILRCASYISVIL